jgi:RNA polymerase sigma-70 factor (ECF subfamily)
MKVTRQEFERLALEQIDVLYRAARRLTRDATRAEDLVQETYARAIRSWETFDLKDHGIKPWLLRILHNLHYSRADRDRRQPIAVDQEHLDAASGVEPSGVPPPGPLDWEELDQNLARALDQLPQEYQSVMLLWAVEELSYKEIAAALDIPIGTVMSRLHRARQRLSEQLHEFARDEGIIRE